jgi:uncharacterized membrane protein (DUF2068 family)
MTVNTEHYWRNFPPVFAHAFAQLLPIFFNPLLFKFLHSMSSPKPNLLLKIVMIKKAIFALILLTISIICSVGWRYDDAIAAWADAHLLNAEYGVVGYGITVLTQANTSTLKLIARVSGAYGGLLAIAVTGLWLSKPWADPLFIGLVGLLLPFEIHEILNGFTAIKLLLFIINLIVFGVLLKHWLDLKNSSNVLSQINSPQLED